MKKKAHSIVALSISVRDANDHKPFNNFMGNRGGVQLSIQVWWCIGKVFKIVCDEQEMNVSSKLTLMRKEAIFFPLSSTILHSLARGSEEVKGGGDSDLQCVNIQSLCSKGAEISWNTVIFKGMRKKACPEKFTLTGEQFWCKTALVAYFSKIMYYPPLYLREC